MFAVKGKNSGIFDLLEIAITEISGGCSANIVKVWRDGGTAWTSVYQRR